METNREEFENWCDMLFWPKNINTEKYPTGVYKNVNVVKNPHFLNRLNTLFRVNLFKYEDVFVVSFYAWLKNKVDNNKLYTTTLNLISHYYNQH